MDSPFLYGGSLYSLLQLENQRLVFPVLTDGSIRDSTSAAVASTAAAASFSAPLSIRHGVD
jgi:hypothetical protein